ncbi:MAG: hypothetical protein V2G42_08535 [bacterium JZ-2024 1]
MQEPELRMTVKEFLDATGFSDQMFQYFVQRGLSTYEERPKGQFSPVRYVTVPDLARFIVNNYRLDLLSRIGIPLNEYLLKGTWRPAPLPERWSVSEVAHFLRVPESVVQGWNDIGAVEGIHEDGLLWFETGALADFLGMTPEEIAFSLPQTMTLKEIRELAIPVGVQMPAGDADFGPDIHQVPFVQVLTRNIGEFVPHRGTIVRFSKLYILDVLLQQGLAKWLVGLRSVKSLRQYVLEQVAGGGKVRVKESVVDNGFSYREASAPLFPQMMEPVVREDITRVIASHSGTSSQVEIGGGRVIVPIGLAPSRVALHSDGAENGEVNPMDPRNGTEKEPGSEMPGEDTITMIETTIRQAIKEAADGQLSRVGARLFAILELLEKSPEARKAFRDASISLKGSADEEVGVAREMEVPAVAKHWAPAVRLQAKPAKPIPGPTEDEVSPAEVSSLKGLLWERRGDFVVRILTDLRGRKYEQRCSVDEFRAILLELKKYAAPHNRLFSTGQIIRALGWNKSNRFKVHLVAFVLAGKDQIRVLGRGKGSRFQITATENDLERTLQEVLTLPEEEM